MLSRDDLAIRKRLSGNLRTAGFAGVVGPGSRTGRGGFQIEQFRRTVAEEQGSGGGKIGRPGPASK